MDDERHDLAKEDITTKSHRRLLSIKPQGHHMGLSGFRAMKIDRRLKIGFGVLMGIIVVVCLLSFGNMSHVDSKAKDIVNLGFEKTVAANRVIEAVKNVYTSFAVIAMNGEADRIEKEKQNIGKARKIYLAELEKLDKLEKSPKRKEFIAKFRDLAANARDTNNKIMELASSGAQKDALQLYLTDVRTQSDVITSAMRELVEYDDQYVKTQLKGMLEANNRTRITLVVFALFAVAFGFGTSFSLVNSISNPLRQAVDVANRLSRGELNI
jgi:methyl-accepting chemotaxis protein